MPWTNDGVLVVNAGGQVIECSTCPCAPPCANCTEVLAFAIQYSQVEVVLNYKAGTGPVGTNCNSLDGTFILDYLPDPTALEGGTNVFGVNDRVWAYELPAPVTIASGLNEEKATHMFFNVNCTFSAQSILCGFRAIRTTGSVVGFYARWLEVYTGPFACTETGVLDSNGVTALCEADGTASYEYIL